MFGCCVLLVHGSCAGCNQVRVCNSEAFIAPIVTEAFVDVVLSVWHANEVKEVHNTLRIKCMKVTMSMIDFAIRSCIVLQGAIHVCAR